MAGLPDGGVNWWLTKFADTFCRRRTSDGQRGAIRVKDAPVKQGESQGHVGDSETDRSSGKLADKLSDYLNNYDIQSLTRTISGGIAPAFTAFERDSGRNSL
jgi:hypothetical protein